MGQITDIQKQKYNKSRVSIFIDGEFVCGLDEVACAAARIKIGDEITPQKLKSVVRDSELNSAFERAVGYLSLSPRSSGEIKKYLKDKGYDGEIITLALDKLLLYHYVDDYAYAKSYISSKSKKYGAFRIKAELRRKGVDSEIIDGLLDEADPLGAYNTAKKYINSHRNTDKQKLKRFLSGRGFGWDEITSALAQLDEEGGFDMTDDDFDYSE